MTLPDDHNLGDIFAGQFHMDWDAEFGRLPAALWQTLNECTDRRLQDLIEGIDAAVRTDPTDADLDEWFALLGLGVYPPGRGEGPTHRQFLAWLREEAQAELARHHALPGQDPPAYRPMLDTWSHGRIGSPWAYRHRDRVTALLTHPSATIELLVAADVADREPETLVDDQWLLGIEGYLNLRVDQDRMVLGMTDYLALPAGTTVHVTAAQPGSRWLRIRMPADPGPASHPHPGAIL